MEAPEIVIKPDLPMLLLQIFNTSILILLLALGVFGIYLVMKYIKKPHS
ncbi:hypothetical protein [Senegalia massiliensis]|nr:hypothetical protein [Senegalia massiliensis]